MNRCIKCGREIAAGELFCIECSLNPGSSLFEDPKPAERHPTPVGRMQTPKPVKRAALHRWLLPDRKRKNPGATAA